MYNQPINQAINQSIDRSMEFYTSCRTLMSSYSFMQSTNQSNELCSRKWIKKSFQRMTSFFDHSSTQFFIMSFFVVAHFCDQFPVQRTVFRGVFFGSKDFLASSLQACVQFRRHFEPLQIVSCANFGLFLFVSWTVCWPLVTLSVFFVSFFQLLWPTPLAKKMSKIWSSLSWSDFGLLGQTLVSFMGLWSPFDVPC